MTSPGESLKQEREARGRTIEEMEEATGIRLNLLAALEQDAFDSLPGRGFVKLYIRAYSEVLGFDPRPVIEAYDRAVQARQAAEPTAAPASAPSPLKAALARWRQERIAERAEADLSDEPEEELEEESEGELEEEPEEEPEEEAFDQRSEPGPIEEHAPPEAPGRLEAQPEAGTAPEIIEEAARAEPEPEAEPEPKAEPEPGPVAMEQETAPELIQEPTVRTVPLHVEAVTPVRPARSWYWPLASLVLLVLLPLMAYLVVSRSKPNAPVAARHEPVSPEAIAPSPSRPPTPEDAEAPPTPPQPRPAREQAGLSSLEVAESGVGLRLVGTRLEGESDRFRSGQRVTFATRVLGGGAGESIRHVWLRDGKVEQSIRLRLGGSSWRTYSTKTLGRPGAWAVEARDERGRVLARADFTAAP